MIKTKPLGPFPLGKNNIADENNLPDGSLREALNVDINDAGWPQLRTGLTQIYSGSDIHSLYKRYFMEGGDLKYLNADNTASVLRSGLTPSRTLTYAEVNGEIFVSNGIENFKVNGEWGIPTPPGQPSLGTTTGNFPAGTYQVAVCWKNSEGELSGVGKAQAITLSSTNGITLSNLPQSPDGYDCVVFVSNTNGQELYYQATVTNGITSYNLYNEYPGGKKLTTQFLEKAPAGQIIRYHQGRIYIADGSTLWYTEAQHYGLYKPSSNFFLFPERITILEPTDNGLFVCSDKTYFLNGTNPKEFSQRVVSDSRGTEGTGLQIEAGNFGLEFDAIIPFWWSESGAVLGLPNGQTQDLTDDRLAHDEVVSGNSMYREIDGIKQIITNLKKGNDINGFGATDYATATVIRNGVVI